MISRPTRWNQGKLCPIYVYKNVILAHQGLLQIITSVPPGSTLGTFLCETPLLISANNVGHEECDRSFSMLYKLGLFQPHVAHICT